MLKKEELNKFWVSRITIDQNPCHYMNKWMDKYAWVTRTAAIKQCWDLLAKSTKVLDIGCGDGKYTQFLTHHMPQVRHVLGVDRPEMVALAKQNLGRPTPFIDFAPGIVGHDIASWKAAMSMSDMVTMLTVYDFLTIEDRAWLRDCARQNMKPGSRVAILDLFLDEVPEYQKRVEYKEVETRDKKIHDWFNAGFDIDRIVPVNYIDTKLFYKLGKNWLSYFLTRALDKVLALFCKPKYSLVVFKKL